MKNKGFNIIDNILISYSGSEEKVVIPDGVTKVLELAFVGNCEMLSLVIPSSVTDIEENAFWCCHELHYVNIENIDQLTKINFRGPGSNPIKQLWHSPELLINNKNIRDMGYQITFDNWLPMGVSRAEHRAEPDFSIEPIDRWSDQPIMLDDTRIAIDFSKFGMR